MKAVVVLALLGAASTPTLAHAEELAVAGKRVVPLAQTRLRLTIEQETFSLRGIPVRRAWRTSKVAPDGTRRIVAGVSPSADPQVDPGEAAIEPADLPALVRDALELASTPTFERPAELVYLLVLGAPVLAWEVQLPLTMRPEPSRKQVWISAMTGRFLDEVEHVRTARARVYPENPSKTPDPIEVELTTLPEVAPGDPLQSEKLVSWNCAAEEPAEYPDWNLDEDECFPVHRTFADGNGDFFVPLPDVIDQGDGIAPFDRYSELSMYYHAERFLDGLADRGVYEYVCIPATLQANKRQLEPEDELDFTPLNNAYFTAQCDPELGATMIFGQGSEVDFAYDADVIYHELGHGIVAMLAPEGLAGLRERHDAALMDAGSINEGLADYMAFMLTEDPRLAEYVGRFWSANSGAEIRDGENERQCPEDSTGEVHNDGEPVQAALWATRSRLDGDTIPSQKLVLDEIVLSALTRLPPDATFEEMAAALLSEAEEFRAVGELDDFGFAVLERSLRTRGLVHCSRVIDDQESVVAGRSMYLRRVTDNVYPFYPGPMQLRYEVPEGVDAVNIELGVRNRAPDLIGAAVLVKWSDVPIAFAYELGALDDPGDATGESGRIREVTLVSGDWDEQLDPVEVEDGEYQLPLRNLQAGQVFHIALASLSSNELAASNVRVVPQPYEPELDDAGGSSDDGDVEPSDDGPDVHGEAPVAGGCGCRSGGAAWPGSALLLMMLVSIRRGRRRA